MKKTAPQTILKTPSFWLTLGGIVFLGAAFIWTLGHLSIWISFLIAAIFSLALGQFIPQRTPDRRVYLFVVAISICLSIVCWVWLLFVGNPPHASQLLLVLLGSLFGSMAASWIKYGFSVNTYIPSPEISHTIKELYLSEIQTEPKNLPAKRALDIVLAFLVIMLTFPLWLVIAVLIWLQDPGPVLFIKNCTGWKANQFRLYKFRTMQIGAEEDTGPIASDREDARVTGICGALRKTALDELPQLVNILLGQMSFVGPRPLRSVVEVDNLREIPGYARRYAARPGLAGLAQICGTNLTPPRQKLRYEQLYIRHASLSFDFKLVIIALLLVFYLRWKKDWDGRIPRSWIRFGNRGSNAEG